MIRVPSAVRLASLIMVAAGAAGGGVLALWALNAGGAARIGSLTLMEHYAGYDKAAIRLIASPPVTEPSRREIERVSRASLHQTPYNVPTAMRLAMMQMDISSRLNPAGLEILQQSYDLVAVTRNGGQLRVLLALENWSQLSPTLRRQVIDEFKALGKIDKERKELRALVPVVAHPLGRSVGLMLMELVDIQAKQRRQRTKLTDMQISK